MNEIYMYVQFSMKIWNQKHYENQNVVLKSSRRNFIQWHWCNHLLGLFLLLFSILSFIIIIIVNSFICAIHFIVVVLGILMIIKYDPCFLCSAFFAYFKKMWKGHFDHGAKRTSEKPFAFHRLWIWSIFLANQ